LNADHASYAVDVYIDHKVPQLLSLQNAKAPQEQVQDQMRQKSDGTFLWVALVFEELRGALRRNLSQVLNGIPKGLTPRIIKQSQQLEYDYPQLCLLNLATAVLAYRPLHMLEIDSLAEEIPDLEELSTCVARFLQSETIISISSTNLQRTISL
jgi:hypothetical protein